MIRYAIRRTVLVVGLVAVALVAVPAVAQTPAVSASGDTTAPGDRATVSVTLEDGQTVKLDGIPNDWVVVAHSDDGRLFNDQVASEGLVGWVNLTGDGTANLSVTFDVPPDETVGDYTVDVTAEDSAATTTSTTTTVSVESSTDSVPALPGAAGPPRSIDDDDKREDVNGDGQANLFDALDYYNNRRSDTIRNNPEAFDFDGDGEAGTLFDALALWNELDS